MPRGRFGFLDGRVHDNKHLRLDDLADLISRNTSRWNAGYYQNTLEFLKEESKKERKT